MVSTPLQDALQHPAVPFHEVLQALRVHPWQPVPGLVEQRVALLRGIALFQESARVISEMADRMRLPDTAITSTADILAMSESLDWLAGISLIVSEPGWQRVYVDTHPALTDQLELVTAATQKATCALARAILDKQNQHSTASDEDALVLEACRWKGWFCGLSVPERRRIATQAKAAGLRDPDRWEAARSIAWGAHIAAQLTREELEHFHENDGALVTAEDLEHWAETGDPSWGVSLS